MPARYGCELKYSAERATAEGDPLEFLRAKLARYRAVKPDDLDLPRFVGGAVGVVGYEHKA